MNKMVLAVTLLAASNLAYAEKSDCRVNVNNASAEDIQSCLLGFGEKKAQAVVDARDKEPFKDLQDFVSRVSGVGEKTAETNRDRICFDDECVSGQVAETVDKPQEAETAEQPAPEESNEGAKSSKTN
jgi:competence protein ComEA